MGFRWIEWSPCEGLWRNDVAQQKTALGHCRTLCMCRNACLPQLLRDESLPLNSRGSICQRLDTLHQIDVIKWLFLVVRFIHLHSNTRFTHKIWNKVDCQSAKKRSNTKSPDRYLRAVSSTRKDKFPFYVFRYHCKYSICLLDKEVFLFKKWHCFVLSN